MADPHPQPTSRLGGIARAASIIAIGNIASRVLGLVREMVKAQLFGAGAATDALTFALKIPLLIYDLTIGGLVNSALVPVFSSYPDGERPDLWRLFNTLITLTTLALSALLLVAVLFSTEITALIGSGLIEQALAAQLLRITLPGVLFLSLSGVVSALLYALKRFTWPAFTGVIFNATLIACALLFAPQMGVAGMALGLLVGSVLQILLQLPGLRDARLRPALALQHPGLRRIVALYIPIIVGLVIAQLATYVGINLATRTGEGGLAWMDYATYLYQFPLGLVATALSFAILPTLARQAADDSPDSLAAFRDTLVQGLNLVLVLIIPATVGLFVLADPIVRLLLERGQFTPFDTSQTALVLRVFLLGLSFAAVDQMLIFAFYARKDTLTPSLVGVASVGVYITTAFALIAPLGLLSLMLADSFKQISHAVVTGVLLGRRLGGFRYTSLGATILKTTVAAAIMGVATEAIYALLLTLTLADSLFTRLLVVAVPASAGALLYLGLITLLRVPELQLLLAALRRRLLP